jgi:8-oxo-dGTP pyrophosphatase MutT (NUDIX family)
MAAPPAGTDRPRDAATVVLTRQDRGQPEVLMGQRGASAVFMPSKYVFPGGAVDAVDAVAPLADPLDPTSARRLMIDSTGVSATALAAAAVRELWEETGLAFGVPGPPPPDPRPPAPWAAFAAKGLRPTAAGLRFVFRAITPRGPARRFDARFFLADATGVAVDLDDFSAAEDELSHLHWVPLRRARALDLPFITEIVLAEVEAHLEGIARDIVAGVPFFDNSGPDPRFRRLE